MSDMTCSRQLIRRGIVSLLALGALAGQASAEMVMKVLVVNPSDTEVREFDIRNPLPPEVKPEHVLDTGGLKVDYDSQAGAYMLIGSVTLKPKEAVTKRILLEDVWVIPSERFTALRRELGDILEKLEGTSYRERGDLLANAVQYNREGGSVTVRASDGWERVRIDVRDTGLGLRPEQTARLFTPFERLDADRLGVQGTGLGLALCKRLTEAMGGAIGVDSAVGEGSTFWVELPRA